MRTLPKAGGVVRYLPLSLGGIDTIGVNEGPVDWQDGGQPRALMEELEAICMALNLREASGVPIQDLPAIIDAVREPQEALRALHQKYEALSQRFRRLADAYAKLADEMREKERSSVDERRRLEAPTTPKLPEGK